MFGDKKNRRGPKPGQFPVANIYSGCMVTFTCDGASKDGDPNQQRVAALKKLEQLDEDGDPVFVAAEPLPAHVVAADRICNRKIGGGKTLNDKSKNPNFETLADKFEENARRREDFQDTIARKRGMMPATAAETKVAKAAAQAENKKAAGSAKPGPKKPKVDAGTESP